MTWRKSGHMTYFLKTHYIFLLLLYLLVLIQYSNSDKYFKISLVVTIHLISSWGSMVQISTIHFHLATHVFQLFLFQFSGF